MSRHVRGSLFVDYVRMVRRRKAVDWSRFLQPEDLAYVAGSVEPSAWYPMETFERLGNAILEVFSPGDLEAVRMWGRLSAEPLAELHPRLVAPHDPLETLMRFTVLRSGFFDFDALDVESLEDGEAHLVIRYHMGPAAEEAASYQTLGFCEGLLSLADAVDVDGEFVERAWNGDPRTHLVLRWRRPARQAPGR